MGSSSLLDQNLGAGGYADHPTARNGLRSRPTACGVQMSNRIVVLVMLVRLDFGLGLSLLNLGLGLRSTAGQVVAGGRW